MSVTHLPCGCAYECGDPTNIKDVVCEHHQNIDNLRAELETARTQAEDLEQQRDIALKALEHYASKKAWTSFVPDSYQGECWEFDWDGDLGDNPWDIAKKALKTIKKKKND